MTPLVPVAVVALLVIAAAFQSALALGAPWGRCAYGGRAAGEDGTLASRYRWSSALTVLVLAVAAWSVLAANGPLLWAFAALFLVNTGANLAGAHPVERWGMGSITAALTAGCLVLALA